MNVDTMFTFKSSLKSEHEMQSPEIVDQILSMYRRGHGKKKIAKRLGISPNTVKRYIRQNGWRPHKSKGMTTKLSGLDSWLEQTFLQHRGNAEVVRQELLTQHGLKVSLRTIERAVKPFRQRCFAQEKATVRFETPPGKQLQIDFGSMTVEIGGERKRVFFFVSTLGYSRRHYVQAFFHERQESWFLGLEGAFQHFQGIPQDVLIDNPRTLVKHHNPVTREVLFNSKFHAFSKYWGFKPKACAPYRARTKGKDENGVGYVKKNAIAGRSFNSIEALNTHLNNWMQTISDQRNHGTTGERPIDRFVRDEASALLPLNGRPPFIQIRQWQRIVHTDACVEVETNFYSVPWAFIKKEVQVQEIGGAIVIYCGTEELAKHPRIIGQKQRSVYPAHLEGIVGYHTLIKRDNQETVNPLKTPELLRDLKEYEAAIGGGW